MCIIICYVCQLCVARKTGKHSPCYVFQIQIIWANCIFSHSLAKLVNIPQGKKIGKHNPLKSGGPPQPWHYRRDAYPQYQPSPPLHSASERQAMLLAA